ncbi:Lrp/AsnC family transcriptional regulator [Mitsuaria sp. WAJ17]|nr:Lrp/AsnC family transcriptional regulator [Mitsuaria sp. WAJ17]
MGRRYGCSEPVVIEQLAQAVEQGSVSRLGGVFAPGSGGAGLLCALAVPPDRLEAVAALVNALPGVNHNYEREHAYSLWFVITGPSLEWIERRLAELEQACGLPALRLPMVRPYRINLGFDLRARGPAPVPAGAAQPARVRAIPPAQRPLAALLEQGLPLQPRPYAAWAQALGWTETQVLATLQAWLDEGVLRRFGVIVRHHELGIASNAMCVFDVPDEEVDAHAKVLAQQPGVTLCYRRERGEGWPFNLFCMIHGRERDSVRAALAAAREAAGLHAFPQAQLFSRRRFKQCGSGYFVDALPALTISPSTQECAHA